MGQLTTAIPPGQKESQMHPNSKLVFMTFRWHNVGGNWGPIWHLGGSLMSLPPLQPAPFCPRVQHQAGSVMHHPRRGPGRNFETFTGPALTHFVMLMIIVKGNKSWYPQTDLLLIYSCLTPPFIKSISGSLSILVSHSPRPSSIPKEAITSLARASPWAVVIVTCRLVDMTTPPWSRDRW